MTINCITFQMLWQSRTKRIASDIIADEKACVGCSVIYVNWCIFLHRSIRLRIWFIFQIPNVNSWQFYFDRCAASYVVVYFSHLQNVNYFISQCETEIYHSKQTLIRKNYKRKIVCSCTVQQFIIMSAAFKIATVTHRKAMGNIGRNINIHIK